MRILVCGSRDWTDYKKIDTVLNGLYTWTCSLGENFHLVHGAAPNGADALADLWARHMRLSPERHPADWDLYGKGAGFQRNEEMVDLGAGLCVGFLMPCSKADCARTRDALGHWSHGASHTLRLSDNAGIPTLRIYGGAT